MTTLVDGPRVVACLSAQAFIEDLLAAIEGGNVEWWRRRYRRADAFLLDDVQQIAGKEQTQDELYNLFNHAVFNIPGFTFGAADFGVVSSARAPRTAQLSARLSF